MDMNPRVEDLPSFENINTQKTCLCMERFLYWFKITKSFSLSVANVKTCHIYLLVMEGRL